MPRARKNMPKTKKRRFLPKTANISVTMPLVSTAVPLVSGVLPRMGAEIPLVTKEIPLVSAQIPLLSAHIPITIPRHWGFLPSRYWARTGLPTERKITVDRPSDYSIVGKVFTTPIQPLFRVEEVGSVVERPGPGLESAKQESLLKELEEYKKREPKLFRKPRTRERFRIVKIGAQAPKVRLGELQELREKEPSMFRRSRKNNNRGPAYRG